MWDHICHLAPKPTDSSGVWAGFQRSAQNVSGKEAFLTPREDPWTTAQRTIPEETNGFNIPFFPHADAFFLCVCGTYLCYILKRRIHKTEYIGKLFI